MSRRSTALTPDDVARLPGPCAGCLRWERFVDRGALDGDGRNGAPEAEITAAKRRWWADGLASGAVGGVVVRAAGSGPGAPPAGGAPGALAGYVTYAVPPRSGGDALTVLGMHVDPGCRGVGLGRALVQAVAREALRRPRVRAVEAVAGRDAAIPAAAQCVVPLDFWLACGFTIVREHPLNPRVRLDARGLAAWRTEVEEAVELAWDRLRGAVRPDPVPGPALSGPVPRSGPTR